MLQTIHHQYLYYLLIPLYNHQIPWFLYLHLRSLYLSLSNITIIGTIAFIHVSKLPGSRKFQHYLHFSDIQTNSTKLAEASNFSNISSKYHKFANVFSKTKAEIFTPHHSYDLQINLEEDAQPLVGPIYSFLASKQEILKDFIEENLNTGFIQPTSSLYGVLVLFVKKKDCSLHLCINYYSLNHISEKDCYLFLLISNLLNLFYKA